MKAEQIHLLTQPSLAQFLPPQSCTAAGDVDLNMKKGPFFIVRQDFKAFTLISGTDSESVSASLW